VGAVFDEGVKAGEEGGGFGGGLVHLPVAGYYRSSHDGSFVAIVAMSHISKSLMHRAQRSTEDDREIAVPLEIVNFCAFSLRSLCSDLCVLCVKS